MEYRCYTFGNMYLSSIQQGIQAAHAVTELFVNQYAGSKNNAPLIEWATHHKTMICLNAGGSQELEEIAMVLGRPDNEFPWAMFIESEEALGGIMTCVAIIIPAYIYDSKPEEFKFDSTLNIYIINDEFAYGDKIGVVLTRYEYELLELIKSKRLAR